MPLVESLCSEDALRLGGLPGLISFYFHSFLVDFRTLTLPLIDFAAPSRERVSNTG